MPSLSNAACAVHPHFSEAVMSRFETVPDPARLLERGLDLFEPSTVQGGVILENPA
jgi:hypothetical protein